MKQNKKLKNQRDEEMEEKKLTSENIHRNPQAKKKTATIQRALFDMHKLAKQTKEISVLVLRYAHTSSGLCINGPNRRNGISLKRVSRKFYTQRI